MGDSVRILDGRHHGLTGTVVAFNHPGVRVMIDQLVDGNRISSCYPTFHLVRINAIERLASLHT